MVGIPNDSTRTTYLSNRSADPLLSTTTSSQLPDVVEGLPKHLQYLQRSGEVHLKSPLATSVKRFFHRDFSPRNVITTLGQCELIYQDIGVGDRMVLKLNEDTIAKIVPGTADTREYSTLTYLDRHYPEFPAPKPRGMMQISGHNLIFMSYIPGETLEKTWSSLDQKQKTAVSAKLDHIFSKLRSQLHQHPQGQAWGGVGGKTCMDHRRTFWESDQVILGPKDFENFFFSQPKWGSKIWITFLRNIYALPEDEQSPQDACVLTHGDLKLANIMVQRDQDGEVNISGIVDWEHSGFYPAYWEAVKVTNGMTPQETSDWYLHLPAAISPLRYPKRWLLDLFWDKHVC